MVEAAIVAASILLATGGAIWQAERITMRRALFDREAAVTRNGQLITNIEDAIRESSGQDRIVLNRLVAAVEAQTQWETLSKALMEEMATIRSRMDDHQREWFNLSTRVQVSQGHKALRIP